MRLLSLVSLHMQLLSLISLLMQLLSLICLLVRLLSLISPLMQLLSLVSLLTAVAVMNKSAHANQCCSHQCLQNGTKWCFIVTFISLLRQLIWQIRIWQKIGKRLNCKFIYFILIRILEEVVMGNLNKKWKVTLYNSQMYLLFTVQRQNAPWPYLLWIFIDLCLLTSTTTFSVWCWSEVDCH